MTTVASIGLGYVGFLRADAIVAVVPHYNLNYDDVKMR